MCDFERTIDDDSLHMHPERLIKGIQWKVKRPVSASNVTRTQMLLAMRQRVQHSMSSNEPCITAQIMEGSSARELQCVHEGSPASTTLLCRSGCCSDTRSDSEKQCTDCCKEQSLERKLRRCGPAYWVLLDE